VKLKDQAIKTNLIDRISIRVRFSEVDSMRVVWHGEYIRYFEDGRESFGRQFGLQYLDVHARGYTIPVVDMHCSYKNPLRVGDVAVIETRYLDCEAAKIKFEYIVYRECDMAKVAEGKSVQVFVNNDGVLELNMPKFYIEWKKKWGLIKE
jgi:acyl-CoA thioester hydrolase